MEDLSNVNRKVKGTIHRRIISHSLVIKPLFVVGDFKICPGGWHSFLQASQGEERQNYIRSRFISSRLRGLERESIPVTGLEWPRGFQEVKVKVKQSRYRPGVAQRVPGS